MLSSLPGLHAPSLCDSSPSLWQAEMSPDTPWAAPSLELSPVPSGHAFTLSPALQCGPLGYSFLSFFKSFIYLFSYSRSLGAYGIFFSCVVWDSPSKNTGVGCHLLLQGIFLTQESNPGLLHCRQNFYWLSYKGSSNSLTRDQTQAPCIGNEESLPLDHQGSPLLSYS